jgi:cell division inhibitor SepF
MELFQFAVPTLFGLEGLAADELRRKKAIILNMENVDKSLTRRVVDFLSGAVYALDGSVKKIAQCTYLFYPHNMAVVGDLENIQINAEINN